MDNNLDTITQIKLPTGQVVDIVDWSDLPLWSSVDLQSGFTAEEIDLFQYVSGRDVTGYGNPNSANPVVKRTSTDADTNIATQGQMTTNEELLVYAMKPEFFMFTTTTVNDFSSRSLIAAGDDGSSPVGMPSMSSVGLAVMQQQLVLQLQITEKVYQQAGLGYFNTGFGVMQQTVVNPGAAATAGGTNTATAGLPSQEAVRSYTIPSHIGAQEKYRVQLLNPSGAPCNFGAIDDVDDGERVLRDDVMVTMRVNLDGLYKRPTA